MLTYLLVLREERVQAEWKWVVRETIVTKSTHHFFVVVFKFYLYCFGSLNISSVMMLTVKK